MKYLTTAPFWLRKLQHPALIWEMPTEVHDPAVYFTFDDGPHAHITPWVCAELDKAEAKATFFCIGNNVKGQLDLLNEIKSRGHTIGNHTQHHINGWKNNTVAYFNDVKEANQLLHTRLFRPPYGRIKRAQASALINDYHIVMWTVLSADFDQNISASQCLRNVLQAVRPGSIIVFHDSEKAFPHLKKVLPKALAYCKEQGWAMRAIPEKW